MDGQDSLLIALFVVLGTLLGVITIFVCCWYFRRRQQRRYLHLQDGASSEETQLLASLSQPRRERAKAQENAALLTCNFYVRTTGEYKCESQLSQIGSNPEKNWFLITPVAKASSLSSSAGSHLLTLQPKSDRLSQWADETSTLAYARTLNNLFSRLFHPYVEPIARLDILYSQKLVVTVKQYQRLGSLKDVLHGAVPTAHFHGKYSYRSSGLPLDRVRTYSRQLLEGLLFLQSKSMPPMSNLHSGNIVIAGTAIQIGSYEYPFLELRSRIYPLLKRATKSVILADGMTRDQAWEVLCFGALVFEMLTGYELGEQIRGLTPKHWHDCGRDSDARAMLTRLFDITQPVLTLAEIAQFPYFSKQKGPLKELEKFSPVPGEYSADVKTLLEQWKNTTRAARRSTLKSSGTERRRSSVAVKPTETSVINLSYTSAIPPPTPKSAPPSAFTQPPLQSAASSPPPPPPPPPQKQVARPAPPPSSDAGDRSSLLENIRLGKSLKKTVTNDRSAPKV